MRSISPDSYWNATDDAEIIRYPALREKLQVEVAVIGAGITGLTAAVALAQQGKSVVVLEAGRIGAGTTGGTSAHLDAIPEQGARKLIRNFGPAAACTLVEARKAAIQQIQTWCETIPIDCDFHRVANYYYTEDVDGVKDLEEECQALRDLGLQAEMVKHLGLPFPAAGGFRVENQARFHAMKYLHGLAKYFESLGGRIFEQSQAQPPNSSRPVEIETAGGSVTAADCVLATHSAYLGISEFDTRMTPYQSYMIAARVADTIDDALYCDDAEPYHYLRRASSADPNLLLVGGADHKTGEGNPTDSFDELENFIRSRFRVVAIEHRWSAELFESVDGVPLIGTAPLQSHIYVATGFAGVGLTYGTAAGLLFAQRIQGEHPELADVVTPARVKALAAASSFIKQNLDFAKRFVQDRFSRDSIESLEEIAPGEGRVVMYEGRHIAVHRDNNGGLTVLSPVCKHAGCHVHWNAAESTWDCPCHGGRYDANGRRIYGPPSSDLDEVAVPQRA